MYSLIITLVAIALVALLALATLYYGADAFFKNSISAEVATLIDQGSQVSGAYQLRSVVATNKTIPLVAGLVPEKYLTAVPVFKDVAWRNLVANDTTLWVPESTSEDTCKAFNLKLNKKDGIPKYPIKEWSKQCYGDGAASKYHILWNGNSTEDISAVVAEAVSNGKDTKDHEVPPDLIIDGGLPSLPGDPPVNGNEWTVVPTDEDNPNGNNNGSGPDDEDNTPPPPELPQGSQFSATFNKTTSAFNESEVVIPVSLALTEMSSKIKAAVLSCEGTTLARAPFKMEADGLHLFLRDPAIYVDYGTARGCPDMAGSTQSISLVLTTGEIKNTEYSLTAHGIAPLTFILNPATVTWEMNRHWFSKIDYPTMPSSAEIWCRAADIPVDGSNTDGLLLGWGTFKDYGYPDIFELTLPKISRFSISEQLDRCVKGGTMSDMKFNYGGTGLVIPYNLVIRSYESLSNPPTYDYDAFDVYKSMEVNIPGPDLAARPVTAAGMYGVHIPQDYKRNSTLTFSDPKARVIFQYNCGITLNAACSEITYNINYPVVENKVRESDSVVVDEFSIPSDDLIFFYNQLQSKGAIISPDAYVVFSMPASGWGQSEPTAIVKKIKLESDPAKIKPW